MSLVGPFATVIAFRVDDPEVVREMNGFATTGGERITLGEIAREPAFIRLVTGKSNDASDTERNYKWRSKIK